MAKETKGQQEIVKRVMHTFREGDLETGNGATVRNRKQAIAIALSEAGASNQQTPVENKKRAAKANQKTAAVRAGSPGKKAAAKKSASL